MEKKYYDTIVSLIKQNEKAVKCEPILEYIVQDVYEHSKVVLETVTNEDVITAYLSKVIKTSFITVPKKLNFDIGKRQASSTIISSIVEPTATVSVKSDSVSEESIDLKSNNTNNTLEEVDDSLLEELSEQVDSEDEQIYEFQEDFQEDGIADEIFEEESNVDTLDLDEQEQNLVELENKINTEKEEDSVLDVESSTYDMAECINQELQIVADSNSVSDVENSSLDLIDTIENFDDIVEDETIISLETKENDVSELSKETEEVELSEFVASNELSDEQAVDKNLVDKMINGVTEDCIETNDLLEESTIESNDSAADDLISLDDEASNSLEELPLAADLQEEQNFLLETETLDVDSLDESVVEPIVEDVDHSLEKSNFEDSLLGPKFECFNYEPSVPDFDNEEICAELKEYDAKYPEKKLLQVCKLKYEDNLSISEIAVQLGFSENVVLDTLNDIIELVKE